MTSQQLISSQTSNPSPAAIPAPNPAVGGTGGFNFGQSGTGSVSMAYGCIMELMALMTQIQSMNTQQAGLSVQVAGDAAYAAYKQSTNAATENKTAGMLDAASSFVSGALAIGGAIASGVSSARSQPELTKQATEKTQLDDFSNKLNARNTAKPAVASGTETADELAATKRAALGDDAKTRITHLTSDASSVQNLANAQIGNPTEEDLNNKAIASMNPEEAKSFSEKLNTAEKINSERTHDINSAMQLKQQTISLSKEMITGVSQGIITVVKTGASTQANIDQATASLYQGQSQQLYGMYNNQAQQATQNQGKVLEALQILAQLNQVRG